MNGTGVCLDDHKQISVPFFLYLSMTGGQLRFIYALALHFHKKYGIIVYITSVLN